MKMSAEMLNQTLKWSNLSVGSEEMAGILDYLNHILDELDIINELDLGHNPIAPDKPCKLESLREDIVSKSLSQKKMLGNAIDVQGNYLVVPKVLE
ncbi:MAG: aspartyl/glutamyl-tRNA amidotransferase subunit C [Clostridiales bacterium]|nr:aspartyl/glutamyl-tRNA amidotransferase subunit C [Clostridiales bacterium]